MNIIDPTTPPLPLPEPESEQVERREYLDTLSQILKAIPDGYVVDTVELENNCRAKYQRSAPGVVALEIVRGRKEWRVVTWSTHENEPGRLPTVRRTHWICYYDAQQNAYTAGIVRQEMI